MTATGRCVDPLVWKMHNERRCPHPPTRLLQDVVFKSASA